MEEIINTNDTVRINNSKIDEDLFIPKIISKEETLNKLLQGNYSMSRFGDGEFKIILGGLVGFQNQSKQLTTRLKEVLFTNDEGILICIPDVFGSLENFEQDARLFWETHINQFRTRYYDNIDKNKVYYDSLITRNYIDLKDKTKCKEYFNKIQLLWDKKDILIIEGYQTRIGVNNNLLDNANSVKRILCPAQNAFDRYDEIYNEVLRLDKDLLILIALGPTASILSYDLFKAGYRALDIGHIDIEYEWFLQNAFTKTKVIGKYVNEVGETNPDLVYDKKYIHEIIKTII